MAEIIDLETAHATGGFASAEVGPAVSGLVSDFGRLGGDEIADEAGEGFRHLIGKRHHAS